MEIKEELLDIEGIKNSKKSLLDLFIRRTAVITSTQEALVEKIVKDQWRQANKATQTGSLVSEIDFCNLGVLFISPNKAKKRVEKINKFIETVQNLAPDSSEKVMKKRETNISQYNDMIGHINYKIFKTRKP